MVSLHRTLLHSCLVLLLAAVGYAQASPVDVANAVRKAGCDGSAGIESRLRDDDKTAEIARSWSEGGKLARFIPQGYGHARFASLHLQGVGDEATLARALNTQFCRQLTTPELSRIGVYRQGTSYWFVLSSAQNSPRASDAEAIGKEVLQLVNQARAQSRTCGSRRFPAAGTLKLNTVLNRAAAKHARDMAAHRKLQHEGFDGSTAATRVKAAGYQWRAVGENIAAGPTTAADVVQMWLSSPGHCENIMSRNFADMGLAYAEEPRTESGVYWAQVFGTRRSIEE